MKKFPSLTLKRVQRKNIEIQERYPQDQKVHKISEKGSVGKKDFLGIIRKITKP